MDMRGQVSVRRTFQIKGEIMTSIIYLASFILIQFICCILFIIVLIKSFTKGSGLVGVLGIITCGFVTFFWGWIKHKHAQVTGVMLLWTFLILALCGLITMAGTSMVLEVKSILKQEGINAEFLDFVDKLPIKKSPAVNKKTKRRTGTGKKTIPKGITAKVNKDAGPYAQAIALWEKGKFTDPNLAIQYLNQAIQQNPNSAEAYNSRGNAYRDLNQLQKAVSDYNQAVRLNPKYVKAYNNRGIINYSLKKYELAMVDYSKAIDLKPSYNLAYLNRGLTYYQLERNNLACKDFQKACELGDCDGLNWAKGNGLCK